MALAVLCVNYLRNTTLCSFFFLQRLPAFTIYFSLSPHPHAGVGRGVCHKVTTATTTATAGRRSKLHAIGSASLAGHARPAGPPVETATAHVNAPPQNSERQGTYQNNRSACSLCYPPPSQFCFLFISFPFAGRYPPVITSVPLFMSSFNYFSYLPPARADWHRRTLYA